MTDGSTIVNAMASQAVAMAPATTLTRRPTITDVVSKVRLLFRTRPYLPPMALPVSHPQTDADVIADLARMTLRLPLLGQAFRNHGRM
jgi:hypothetical protein